MFNTNLSISAFGRTGENVTAVGLGGGGVLRTTSRDDEAEAVIAKAFEEGIRYFDSAHVYADSELYYGSVWTRFPKKRAEVFQTSKSASRDREGALSDLARTLERLRTSYLDLWQIHDVRDELDLAMIAGPGGALEAFIEAREAGKVRFIGVTGHHDPGILSRAVREWPVDAVMMPVNPVEEIIGGFLTETLEAARKKDLAVIAMKTLGASHYILRKYGITPDILVRYALSHGVSVAIVGCASAEEAATLAGAGKTPALLNQAERNEIMELYRPYARRMAFYRGVL